MGRPLRRRQRSVGTGNTVSRRPRSVTDDLGRVRRADVDANPQLPVGRRAGAAYRRGAPVVPPASPAVRGHSQSVLHAAFALAAPDVGATIKVRSTAGNGVWHRHRRELRRPLRSPARPPRRPSRRSTSRHLFAGRRSSAPRVSGTPGRHQSPSCTSGTGAPSPVPGRPARRAGRSAPLP